MLRSVSQPVPTSPSQSAKVPLQAIEHAPPLQLGVPFTLLHAFPQVPQCSTLMPVFTSQPFSTLPSQFMNGAVQVMAHAPPVHDGVPPVLLQALPQAPQCSTFEFLSTSQPLAALPSQLAKDPVQVMPQAPPLHDGVPPAVLQALPQPPQCSTLPFKFASQPFCTAPSQLPKPALQPMVQLPAVQPGVPLVPLQALPQVPQWLTLELSTTSQPLAALPSQLPKPALHTMPQLPALQKGVPFVPPHTLPQLPQLVALLFRLVSQPLATLPSQLPKPALQAMAHLPALQLAVPFTLLHCAPHAPQ